MPGRRGWLLLLLAAACGESRRAGPPAGEPDAVPAAAAALAGCAAADPVPTSSARDTLDGPALALVIDLPAYRLTALEADSVVAAYPVAIGARAYPTPRGSYAISRIEWNPWWIPPASAWAAGRVRTPPGPGNPLGPVKMEFLPLYLVHGTSDSASIGKAVSHGCVRLRNADAIALAERVQRHGAPESAAALATADRRGPAPRTVPLGNPVPLTVRYELVEVADGVIRAYPDVYRLRRAGAEAAAARRLADALGLDSAAAGSLAARLLDLARDSAILAPAPPAGAGGGAQVSSR